MYKKIPYLITLLLFSLTSSVWAEIKTEVIDYQVDEVALQGYLAWDDAIKGTRPAILVVHEWWGHNAYARQRADKLAKLGYTAFALDLYGKGKEADHPKQAKAFMNAVLEKQGLVKNRFQAAIDQLKQHDSVDKDKISAIGYCFGGGVVLEMARVGMDLDGVASFHGGLGTKNPAEKGKVLAKVKVFNGADDPMVPAEQISAFEKEMQAAGVDYELINYPDTKHSFTNPVADEVGKKFGLPLAYNADADKDSWQKLQDFLTHLYPKAQP